MGRHPKRTHEGDLPYRPRRGRSLRMPRRPLRGGWEDVSIAPFHAIHLVPSTNQRSPRGFVCNQSPRDNGVEPSSSSPPSPPRRCERSLSSTVHVQIRPFTWEGMGQVIRSPTMRRIRRGEITTIGGRRTPGDRQRRKKKKEKKRKERGRNGKHPVHRIRRGKATFVVGRADRRTFLCRQCWPTGPSCEDLVPPIIERHGRWKERRGPSRIHRSRARDLLVRNGVLCGRSIRTFLCRRGCLHHRRTVSQHTTGVTCEPHRARRCDAHRWIEDGRRRRTLLDTSMRRRNAWRGTRTGRACITNGRVRPSHVQSDACVACGCTGERSRSRHQRRACASKQRADVSCASSFERVGLCFESRR